MNKDSLTRLRKSYQAPTITVCRYDVQETLSVSGGAGFDDGEIILPEV